MALSNIIPGHHLYPPLVLSSYVLSGLICAEKYGKHNQIKRATPDMLEWFFLNEE